MKKILLFAVVAFTCEVQAQNLFSPFRGLAFPRLTAAGFGVITTEVLPAPEFYFAEDYHQQYLHKNPGGYCGLGGTGVSCPVGTGVSGAS